MQSRRRTRAVRVSIYSAVFGNRSDYEIIKPRIQASRGEGRRGGIRAWDLLPSELALPSPRNRRLLEINAIHHARGGKKKREEHTGVYRTLTLDGNERGLLASII